MKKVTKQLADKFAKTFFGYFIENVQFNNINYFEDFSQHTIKYVVGRAQLCIFQAYGADAPIELCERPTPVGFLEINAQFITYLTMLDSGEVVPIKADEIKADEPMTATKLAELTGRSKTIIYRMANKLGRLPTVEEVQNSTRGRPKKYQ